MLRHLKMELKRQEQQQQQQAADRAAEGSEQQVVAAAATATSNQKPATGLIQPTGGQQKQRRVRGRRSSKPMMEKRRRARINECLDILKTYVLTDSTNLTKLGIDCSANENRDEETIARRILKSSGLINRHRGRKNPNKLEKADILELTVDYVRRLHEQRDELITGQQQSKSKASGLNQPLSLNLPTRLGLQSTPPSPPPSSASTSPQPQPLLSISSNIIQLASSMSRQSDISPSIGAENSIILDLSETNRVRNSTNHQHPQVSPSGSSLASSGLSPSGSCSSGSSSSSGNLSMIYNPQKSTLMVVGPDGVWRPWNPMALQQTMTLDGVHAANFY